MLQSLGLWTVTTEGGKASWEAEDNAAKVNLTEEF